MIEAVIFDMDGLLIDSEPFWRKAEIEVFGTVGLTLTEDDCRQTMGYRLNEVVDLWYSREPWQGKSKKAVESEILERVAQLIRQEGQLLPGVEETLKLCRDISLKMAIASSSAMALIEAVVDRFKLASSFDILHSAQWEKFGKPHPDVFIHTAEKLGVNSENCLVLEDSFHGMVAGLAAKMKVVAVPEKMSPEFEAAHLVLEQLSSVAIKRFIERV